MKYTIFGSTGFIGSNLAAEARAAGHDVCCPGRDDVVIDGDPGHVIYCIGVTADFRRRPYQTIDAHVMHLQKILQQSEFETFTYLSSTRVYQHCVGPVVTEEAGLNVRSQDSGDLYNISKLLGESLLQLHGDGVRIARLSNVVGNDITSDNFLFSVMRDACGPEKCTFSSRRIPQKITSISAT